nr:ribonucleotide-diphosphate reductase subunit alpha [Candidatus Syntrophosphaera sp.]
QSPMWHKGKMITSCGDAVGQALETFLKTWAGGELKAVQVSSGEAEIPEAGAMTSIALCPDCGSSIEHVEGCLKCPACGWSKC